MIYNHSEAGTYIVATVPIPKDYPRPRNWSKDHRRVTIGIYIPAENMYLLANYSRATLTPDAFLSTMKENKENHFTHGIEWINNMSRLKDENDKPFFLAVVETNTVASTAQTLSDLIAEHYPVSEWDILPDMPRRKSWLSKIFNYLHNIKK